MNYSPTHLVFLALVISSGLAAMTINVPDDYSTIQAALTAAHSSDTVLVQPGTYAENIIWPDVNGIKLISAGDSSNTIIDGGGISSVIYMNPTSATINGTTEIRGFKIINGGSIAYGGGMFVSNASPMLSQLWIADNSAIVYGGGLYIDPGSPTMSGVSVTGNMASRGGGGIFISGGSPTLTHVTVTGNTATFGGGLCISGAISPTLTYVTVSHNNATRLDGGGFYISGNVTLTDVIVSDNTAGDRGGGLCILGAISPTLTHMTVTDNRAASGGGIHITGNPALTYVTVINNMGSYGGGLYIYSGSPTLTHIIVSRNLGAGLYFKNGSGMLVNVTITGNTSGIYVEGGTPTIASSNIAFHGVGLYNADNTNIVDATSNWWGDSSGPYHPTQNTGGQGNSVNAFVNITPWLTEPDTAAPPIPVQNLTVTESGDDFVGLSWDTSPIGDLAGYKVYYDTDNSGYPYTQSIDVGNVTSYTLSGLSLITDQYFIAMTCYDSDGNESWYSSEAVTSIIDIVSPASPQNLSAQAGDQRIALSWTANTEDDFLRYRIYSGTAPNPAVKVDSTTTGILDTTAIFTGLVNGTTYYYRVTAVDTSGNESTFSNEVGATPSALSIDSQVGIPSVFALHQNYPNPFNPISTIQYDLPTVINVNLVICDVLGREVIRLVDQEMQPGYHRTVWDARDDAGRAMPTGIYIARLITPEYTKSIKMLFLK